MSVRMIIPFVIVFTSLVCAQGKNILQTINKKIKAQEKQLDTANRFYTEITRASNLSIIKAVKARKTAKRAMMNYHRSMGQDNDAENYRKMLLAQSYSIQQNKNVWLTQADHKFTTVFVLSCKLKLATLKKQRISVLRIKAHQKAIRLYKGAKATQQHKDAAVASYQTFTEALAIAILELKELEDAVGKADQVYVNFLELLQRQKFEGQKKSVEPKHLSVKV